MRYLLSAAALVVWVGVVSAAVSVVHASDPMFGTKVDYATGNYPESIFSIDLDGDGDNDLATANTDSDDVSILLNNGDGTFQNPVSYPAGDGPQSIFLIDLDGDGDNDLATAGRISDNVSILLNNGDGTFQNPVSYVAGNSPFSVFSIDLDGDGDNDLAIANAESHNVSILLNDGNGLFQSAVNYAAGDYPYSVFSKDLDGDGDHDLAIANAVSNNVSILFNDGDGTFQSPVNYAAGVYPYSVFSTDLDGDGDNDLATANGVSDNVSILLNDGDGTFQSAVNYDATDEPWSVFSIDLDGDGDNDLATANRNSDDVSILLNNGDGTFQSAVNYATGDGSRSVFSIDLDGDGDNDLAVANAFSNSVSILFNLTGPYDSDGDGVFDHLDNCPDSYNPGQEDSDGDSSGDVCDNCPEDYNPNQEDADADGIGDACVAPEVTMLLIGGDDPALNVLDHTPLIEWSYTDPLEQKAQTQVEVAVGTDDDWQYAKMWNPAPFQTPDTFVTYAGIELLDSETYYLRLRVHNGVAWSDWYEISFRMNSLPSVPVPLSPVDDAQTDNQPTLWVQNSIDAEGDALTYDFFCCVDTSYGEPDPVYEYDIAEGTDSTGWQVTEPLEENKRYGWIVRAYDGYEYSDWTASYEYMFFVNGTPEPPTAPQAQYPPDTSGLPVFDMLSYFYWSPSNDPDPLDTVRYKLEVSIDPGFTFVNTIDSLMSTPYTLTDSLAFSTHYWWRVTAFDNTGLATMSSTAPDFWTWVPGDIDHSHTVDISDLVWLVDYMFNGGPAPYPLFVADIDGSCGITISDLVYLVDFMFLGGPPPAERCV